MSQAKQNVTFRAFFGTAVPGRTTKPFRVSEGDWDWFTREYVARTFECFTITKALGYYKGAPETTYVLEVIVIESDDIADTVESMLDASQGLQRLGREWCRLWRQDCVLVEEGTLTGTTYSSLVSVDDSAKRVL